MRRSTISRLAHAHHPVAAPLADATVDRLLRRALDLGPEPAEPEKPEKPQTEWSGTERPDPERLLDLGCGTGEWLLRALAARPRLTAVGVDLDGAALERARAGAVALGAADRLALHERDAAEYPAPGGGRGDGPDGGGPFDVVLSVGAAHAFGGLLPTLAAARRHLAPGGRVLIGDGFWEREPDEATLRELDATPEDYTDLATTVDRVTADGWTPVYGHTSTPGEWDDYEWSWTGSLARWALDHPDEPGADQAARTAAAHRSGWLRGYRGTFGFVTLVLRVS